MHASPALNGGLVARQPWRETPCVRISEGRSPLDIAWQHRAAIGRARIH
jgi:hypothetical protein